MKLNELTITEAAAGLRAKKFSARELVSDCLEAIAAKDKELHSYLEVFEDAQDQAKKADDIIAAGSPQERLPALLGIPMAVKDNILIEGKRCTAGSKILENYIGAYDASVIKKLKDQGTVFLGKTNLDEFAMGASTENSAFGPTKNPHDTSRVPGGSSGGSAAAVAAHLCTAALGSDTGGSIRQPAAFCGVVGLKPTYGRVSRHGLIAMASSLDQIGPLAKTVDDAAILFQAIAGKDFFDSTAVQSPSPENSDLEILKDPKKLRIGVPKEYFGDGLDPEVKNIVESAISRLEKSGSQIKEVSLPHAEYSLPAYYVVVFSEVSSNLARFDGVRFGYKKEGDNLLNTYLQTRGSGLGEEVKRRIMLGTYALSAGYYDAYYLKAQKVRSLIRQNFEKAFEKVDVLIGPITPTPAFKLGEKTNDPLQMYLEDIYTAPLNLAGLPGISLPGGSVAREGKSLPVGVQLIGSWFQEEKLLGVAKFLEILLKTKV
jgi:aspartyl-tRNA(Asn)/glutamyl-tRNA(Gln) amidotransferase subunit A